LAHSQDEDKPTQPSMAELLEQSTPLQSLRHGDVVEGQVMRADEDGILVSIGHKSEGIIPQHEMQSLLPQLVDRYPVGAKILVYVIDMSGAEGQVVLSFDKARGEESWLVLQECIESGNPVDGKIVGYNRGGAVVDIDGLQAFIPLSQVVMPLGVVGDPEEALAQRVGEHLRLKVLEVNRRRNRAVLSERALVREQREGQKEKLLAELTEGEVRKGEVTGVSSFGAFVDMGGADGLIHISELSWTPVTSVEEVVHVGQEVDVYVLRVDRENKRIALSLRRLSATPWDQAAQRFELGQLVTATVTKLMDFGAFARLEDSIEGLIHVSELSDKHIQHPREVVQVGDALTLRIVSMDLDRHRMGLSLKQVEEYQEAQPVEISSSS
jgi:small subunit ribosomal protein S1